MSALEHVSPLGFALLGLLRNAPTTGYALRKAFETTPLAVYSSSPGSIYPALKKLEQLGLIGRSPAPGDHGKFQILSLGKDVLDRWLRLPIQVEDVRVDLDAALLRFAFLQDHPDPSATLHFLESFEDAVLGYLAELKSFVRSEAGEQLSAHARLAVEHGLMTIASSAEWAKRARRQFEKTQIRGAKR